MLTKNNNCYNVVGTRADNEKSLLMVVRTMLFSNKFLVRLHGEYNILVKLCGNTNK